MENVDTFERRCDLPYGAEYAKSGRAGCKGCRTNITDGSLRMSAREQSHFFDGLQDNWFHFPCFWKRMRKGRDQINERSIRGMEHLKWDDQEKIRAKLVEFNSGPSTYSIAPQTVFLSSLKVEASKSNRGKCATCSKNFALAEPKINLRSGWRHLACVFTSDFANQGRAEDINGFSTLSDEGRQKVVDAVASIKKESTTELTSNGSGESAELEEAKPTAALFVEGLEVVEPFSPKRTRKAAGGGICEMITLNLNGDEVSTSSPRPEREGVISKKPRRAFGADSSGGDAERNRAILKAQSDKSWELRNQLSDLLTREQMSASLIANEQDVPTKFDHILSNLVDCCLFGKPARCPKCPRGQLVFSSSSKSYICLGHVTAYTKCIYDNRNPTRTPFVFPKDVVEATPAITEVKINVFRQREYSYENEKVLDRRSSSSFKSFGPRHIAAAETYDGDSENAVTNVKAATTTRQIVKNGTVVDQEFEFAADCFVCRSDEDKSLYQAHLVSTDMVQNKNSYYKIQLYKHDIQDRYYLFKSWGRVGTTVGGTKTDCFHNFQIAITAFEMTFSEKTGNQWSERKYFRKREGKFGLVETDYSEIENAPAQSIAPGTQTKLHLSIKKVMLMIYDVEKMREAAMGFDLDMQKMPLGKLSKNQLLKAYSVLTELEKLLQEPKVDQVLVVDASNRFYTLVPHNFGLTPPVVLSDLELVKNKSKMVDALMEIQVAYDGLKANQEFFAMRDPIDVHYDNLKCDMQYVPPSSSEFLMVQTYLANTHGHTHNTFTLRLLDVLRLDRAGENTRFTSDIPNRMLLWHGSRAANYVGILSQGLRIAPPEAPAHGYMFGKGIYFADMVSKSANYCHIHKYGDEGLMLLCEVALGNMQEEKLAKNFSKPPAGFQSVKGLGSNYPNPDGSYEHPDGYRVPYGKADTRNVNDPSMMPNQANYQLLYNEYIVYDVSQVKLKYLCRIRFDLHRGSKR